MYSESGTPRFVEFTIPVARAPMVVRRTPQRPIAPMTANRIMTAAAVTTEIRPVGLRTSEMWREAIMENIRLGNPTRNVNVDSTFVPCGPKAFVLPRTYPTSKTAPTTKKPFSTPSKRCPSIQLA